MSQLVHFAIWADADMSSLIPNIQPIIQSDRSDPSRLFVKSSTIMSSALTPNVRKFWDLVAALAVDGVEVANPGHPGATRVRLGVVAHHAQTVPRPRGSRRSGCQINMFKNCS